MAPNVNTQAYWNQRFASGDWEEKQGRWQTRCFAKGQLPHLKIEKGFAGTLLDFGCGLGDAMPVYREQYPQANLVGIDISSAAVEKCRKMYGALAEFRQGGVEAIPDGVDVIIASNVLEHLDDDLAVVRTLLAKCSALYVVVPYREQPLFGEHVRSYDKNRFSAFAPCERRVFACRGWSAYGRELWVHTYAKNVFRFLRGRPLRRRNRQILFRFMGERADRRRDHN